MKECYVCKKWGYTHTHHIYNKSDKKTSEKYGALIDVCPSCHDEIHRSDNVLNNSLKREFQRKIELSFMDDGMNQFQARDTFILLIGRNYL